MHETDGHSIEEPPTQTDSGRIHATIKHLFHNAIAKFPNSISTANHPWKNKKLIVISFEHFHIFNNCLDFTFVCLLLLRRLLVPSSSDPSFVGLLCIALLTEVQQIQMNFARRYFPTNAKNVICIPNFLTYNVNGSPYNPYIRGHWIDTAGYINLMTVTVWIWLWERRQCTTAAKMKTNGTWSIRLRMTT